VKRNFTERRVLITDVGSSEDSTSYTSPTAGSSGGVG